MRKTKRREIARLKTKLRLPDREQAKSAVLASLRSPESQRSYRHAIDEFVLWYCSDLGSPSTKLIRTDGSGAFVGGEAEADVVGGPLAFGVAEFWAQGFSDFSDIAGSFGQRQG
jgi:hypothetical protein